MVGQRTCNALVVSVSAVAAYPIVLAVSIRTPHGEGHVRVAVTDDDVALLAVERAPVASHALVGEIVQRHHHRGRDPRQRPAGGIGAHVPAVLVLQPPHDATVLRGPVAIDVVWGEVLDAKAMDRSVDRLGAESGKAQRAHVVGREKVGYAWHRHDNS